MALIHADAKEALPAELELFSIYPTQTAIEETRYTQIYPSTSLDRGGPLSFVLAPTEKTYIDGRKVFLYLKTRILSEDTEQLDLVTSEDDDTLPDGSLVYPINYFHATAFRTVDVYMNGKNISTNDTMYPYRAYFETLLSYGKGAKEEALKAALWYRDKNPVEDVSDAIAKKDVAAVSNNIGAVSRWHRTKGSQVFETFGPIHSEIFMQDKLIPGFVELTIKLHRADTKFSLMAKTSDRFTISYDSAILYVCHKKISDSVREAHQMTLQKRPMMFPLHKGVMKFFTRGAQRSDLSEANLASGILPRRIVFGLVDSLAFSGNNSKCFQFSCKNTSLKLFHHIY